MKQIASLLFAIAVSLSACASPITFTSTPIEQDETTSLPQATEVIAVENTTTATFTPEPTSTPTPVRLPPHWYWGLDFNTNNLLSVNQFGETHEIGSLEISEETRLIIFSLDVERAILFTHAQHGLLAYLLGSDDIQPIELPDETSFFDLDLSWSSLQVVGMYGDFAIISYTNQGGSNVEAERGPVLLVDLKSITAEQIDEEGNVYSSSDTRLWFHTSADGRYVRYVNGDRRNTSIREVDLASGAVRTIYEGADSYISGSTQGDLWFLRSSQLILDADGNQTDFKEDNSFAFRAFAEKKGVIFPRYCEDNCELRVVSPFGNEAELKYTFPWGIQDTSFTPLLSQFLPDQSLIFVGDPYTWLPTSPAIVEAYPDLLEDDEPVFRLSPDGQARIVGVYRSFDFELDRISASSDGRYFLLKSLDQTSLFVYDAVEDRPLFSMPAYADLDPLFNVIFSDQGIIVHVSVLATADTYRDYVHAYSYDLAKAISWDAEGHQFPECEDILPDGSLICWVGEDIQHANLIRYDPATAEVTILKEDIGFLAYY